MGLLIAIVLGLSVLAFLFSALADTALILLAVLLNKRYQQRLWRWKERAEIALLVSLTVIAVAVAVGLLTGVVTITPDKDRPLPPGEKIRAFIMYASAAVIFLAGIADAVLLGVSAAIYRRDFFLEFRLVRWRFRVELVLLAAVFILVGSVVAGVLVGIVGPVPA